MASPAALTNPYVGPRSFQQGEKIYGRDRELNELLNLIYAERIVLLHSPSGAGKTSLIQAGVVPQLVARRFDVLPLARVNVDLSATPNGHVRANRYIAGTILSLEEGRSTDGPSPASVLAGMTLSRYLEQRTRRPGSRFQVLIFDQFEEILTLDPTDRGAKQEFFRQVSEALVDKERWALFSMREDFLGALDPYILPIPNRFRATFRLDLLGTEAATEAVREPARAAGVVFEDAAAEQLIDDLRTVRVQQPDGTVASRLGLEVEPVHLQVACHRLWDSVAGRNGQITRADLASSDAADESMVDQSLASYYDQRLSATIADTGVSERAVREWFDNRLTTEFGTRGTVIMGPEESGGLDNEVIRRLIDAHLVRGENRGGATWFELSHDRLISPVQASNAAWYRENLSLVQEQAGKWDQQGRPESLLLRGEDLAAAEDWAAEYDDELKPDEADYLAAGRQLRNRERRAMRRTQLIAALAIAFLGLAAYAFILSREAKNNERRAQEGRSDAMSLLAESLYETVPSQGLLLAIDNIIRTTEQPGRHRAQAEEALRAGLSAPRGVPLGPHAGVVDSVAISPDGQWVATASRQDKRALLWRTSEPGIEPRPLDHDGPVWALAFSPDGQWLATGGTDRMVRLWALGDSHEPVKLDRESPVSSIAFSERWIAVAGGRELSLWEMSDGTPVSKEIWVPKEARSMETVAIDPDGEWLAAGHFTDVLLWRLSDPQDPPKTLARHEQMINAIAFNPDGSWLAAASEDTTVSVAELSSVQTRKHDPLTDHTEEVSSLTYGGAVLVTGSADSTARVWTLDGGRPTGSPRVLQATHPVTATTTSTEERWVAVASADGATRIWDILDPEGNPLVLRGHDKQVVALAVSERWLVTGSQDRFARIFELSREADAELEDLVVDRLVVPAAVPKGSTAAVVGTTLMNLWHGAPDNEPDDAESSQADADAGQPKALTMSSSQDGQQLAVGGDGRAWLWDRSRTERPILLDGHSKPVMDVALHVGGQWAVTRDADVAYLWDLRTSTPRSYELDVGTDNIRSASFHPRRPQLVTGGGSQIVLWELEGVQLVPQIIDNKTEDFIDEIVFGGNGQWLVAIGRKQTRLMPWSDDPDLDADWATLPSDRAPIKAAASDPRGRWLATGSDNGRVQLWNPAAPENGPVHTGEPRRSGAVSDVAFSPSGNWLATAGVDHQARLWTVNDDGFASPSVALEHEAAVSTVVFSPDEQWVTTLTEDKRVRSWLLPIEALVDRACAATGRNLSQEEWESYYPGDDYRVACEAYAAPFPTDPSSDKEPSD